MSIFEYNAKLHEDTLREDSREAGEARMAKLYKTLTNENRLEDWSKALEDTEYKNKLFEEFNL